MSRRTGVDSHEVESTENGWTLELASWTRPGLHPTTILLAALPMVFFAALTTTVIAIRSSSRSAHAVPHELLIVAWPLTMLSAAAMFGMNAMLFRLLINRLANRFGRRELVLAGRTLSLRRHWVIWRTVEHRELQGAERVQLSAEGELLIAFEGQMPMRIAPGPMTDEARSLQRTLEKALKSSERRVASANLDTSVPTPAAPLTPTPGAYAIVAFGLLFTTVSVAIAVVQDVKLTRLRSVPATMLTSGIVRRATSKGGESVTAEVQFAYTVDGVAYQSDRLWPVGSPADGSEVAAEIAGRPKGARVLALYPAGFPSQAYLVPRRGNTAILILIGGVFILLGIFKVARWPKTQLRAATMWTVLGAIPIGDGVFGPMGSITADAIVAAVIWIVVAAIAFMVVRANQHWQIQSGCELESGDVPPPVAPQRRAIIKPLVVAPAPQGSRLVASEIAAGGVRILIPRNSPLAIACASLLVLALITLFLEVAGHAPWFRLINPNAQQADVLAFIAISAIAAVLFSFVLVRALANRIFEANQTALYRSTEGPLGRLSRRWKQEDIASLDVVTRVHQGGRGGTRTVDTLELRLNAGRTVKLMGDLTKAELEWMGELLSAALRIPVSACSVAGSSGC